MKKSEKKFLLKTAKQLVARCSEYTPPEVKYSKVNYIIAKAMLSIDEAIKIF